MQAIRIIWSNRTKVISLGYVSQEREIVVIRQQLGWVSFIRNKLDVAPHVATVRADV